MYFLGIMVSKPSVFCNKGTAPGILSIIISYNIIKES
jgi:hypothetical protein